MSAPKNASTKPQQLARPMWLSSSEHEWHTRESQGRVFMVSASLVEGRATSTSVVVVGKKESAQLDLRMLPTTMMPDNFSHF